MAKENNNQATYDSIATSNQLTRVHKEHWAPPQTIHWEPPTQIRVSLNLKWPPAITYLKESLKSLFDTEDLPILWQPLWLVRSISVTTISQLQIWLPDSGLIFRVINASSFLMSNELQKKLSIEKWSKYKYTIVCTPTGQPYTNSQFLVNFPYTHWLTYVGMQDTVRTGFFMMLTALSPEPRVSSEKIFCKNGGKGLLLWLSRENCHLQGQNFTWILVPISDSELLF